MTKKAGYIGVVGLPNAGKSSLVNHITRAKVSITSNKPQTTRKNITGILTQDETQYVFVDAPGFIQSEKGLNSFLETEWKKVIEDVDVLVFAFSLDSKKESFERILDMMESVNKPKVALITKTDLDFPNREVIIENALRSKGIKYFKSKRKGKTHKLEVTQGFLEELEEHLPKVDEFYFDKELYTTQTLRELAKETILESMFRFLNNEIPYEVGVVVRDFEEKPNIYKVYADVVVSKERYKKIVVGKGGQNIKKLGTLARKSMEHEFGTKVFLDLRVKDKEDWNKKPRLLKEMGYHAEQG